MERDALVGVALTLVVTLTVLAVSPPVTAQSPYVTIDPATIEHGDTEQSMEVFVGDVSEPTEVVVNLTALTRAGVDVSNASVAVTGEPQTPVTATLARPDGDALIRLELSPDPDAPPTDVSFTLQLTGLDTTEAAHTRLSYGLRYDGERADTQEFKLANPDLPWVSVLTRSDTLVTGKQSASQSTRVNLEDVPAAETATIRVDMSALAARNVSFADASASADLTEPDEGGTLRRVNLTGHVVELHLRTTAETDVTIELTVQGLDTRQAAPTDSLHHVIEYEGPAGTMAGTTESFGLYAPGNTPTPTPSPTNGLTTTPTPSPGDGLTPTQTASTATTATPSPTDTTPVTPTPGSDGPGFGPVVALLAVLGLLPLARRL